MTSTAEENVQALYDLLFTLSTPTLDVLRDDSDDRKIPRDGLIIVRDGDPGEPEVLLSGIGPYAYQHVVPVEIYVQAVNDADRARIFDDLLVAIGGKLEGDRHLGGRVEFVEFYRPAAEPEGIEGGPNQKNARLPVALHYMTQSPI